MILISPTPHEPNILPEGVLLLIAGIFGIISQTPLEQILTISILVLSLGAAVFRFVTAIKEFKNKDKE